MNRQRYPKIKLIFCFGISFVKYQIKFRKKNTVVALIRNNKYPSQVASRKFFGYFFIAGIRLYVTEFMWIYMFDRYKIQKYIMYYIIFHLYYFFLNSFVYERRTMNETSLKRYGSDVELRRQRGKSNHLVNVMSCCSVFRSNSGPSRLSPKPVILSTMWRATVRKVTKLSCWMLTLPRALTITLTRWRWQTFLMKPIYAKRTGFSQTIEFNFVRTHYD